MIQQADTNATAFRTWRHNRVIRLKKVSCPYCSITLTEETADACTWPMRIAVTSIRAARMTVSYGEGRVTIGQR